MLFNTPTHSPKTYRRSRSTEPTRQEQKKEQNQNHLDEQLRGLRDRVCRRLHDQRNLSRRAQQASDQRSHLNRQGADQQLQAAAAKLQALRQSDVEATSPPQSRLVVLVALAVAVLLSAWPEWTSVAISDPATIAGQPSHVVESMPPRLEPGWGDEVAGMVVNMVEAWRNTWVAVSEASTQREDLLTDRISRTYGLAPDAARHLVRIAQRVAMEYDLDPVLLLAVVAVESRFHPYLRSHADAHGLVQVIPRWHPEKIQRLDATGARLYDPEINLMLGAEILNEYLGWHNGNQTKALQQFNGSLKDTTRRYSRRVQRVYLAFNDQLPEIPTIEDWVGGVSSATAHQGDNIGNPPSV